MTIYDNGLIRAMKAAYRDGGYDVAMTEDGLLIQGKEWGVKLNPAIVPNSIKSLIVLHNGAMPRMDRAVHIEKGESGEVILEMVTGAMEDLAVEYTAKGGMAIKPTRVTFDGKRVWQLADTLSVRLVDPDNQQMLMFLHGENPDVHLVGGILYCRMHAGCSVYIRPEFIMPEDKPLLEHLSQMQWIPVEME